MTMVRRRTLLAAPAALAACRSADRREGQPLRPSTVEGPPRRFLVVEIVRQALTAPGTDPGLIEACRWHVSPRGELYGDHWGWCEDFVILPLTSPGYLLATTLYSGGTSGGAGTLHPLPPFPATLAVFGQAARLDLAPSGPGGAGVGDGAVGLAFGERTLVLRPGVSVDLGGAAGVSVEAPVDTGHFAPGGNRPVLADVRFSAVSHGLLDSRRIAGRS
jgi:hypothetical protein